MTKQRSLLVAPQPFINESPCSWLTRLAQMHAAAPHEVLAAVGQPTFHDPDIEMMQSHLSALLYGVGIGMANMANLVMPFRVFRAHEWTKEFLRRSPQRSPCTSICRQCLAEDIVPYWRIEWRLKHWQICPTHFFLMEDVCAKCEGRILISSLTARRHHKDQSVGDCRICAQCGADLVEGEPRSIERTGEVLKLIALQKAVTASLVQGFFLIEGVDAPLPLTLLPRVLAMGGIAGPLSDGNGRELYPHVQADLIAEARHIDLTGRTNAYRRRDGRNQVIGVGKVWRGTVKQLARIIIRHSFENVARREACRLSDKL